MVDGIFERRFPYYLTLQIEPASIYLRNREVEEKVNHTLLENIEEPTQSVF